MSDQLESLEILLLIQYWLLLLSYCKHSNHKLKHQNQQKVQTQHTETCLGFSFLPNFCLCLFKNTSRNNCLSKILHSFNIRHNFVSFNKWLKCSIFQWIPGKQIQIYDVVSTTALAKLFMMCRKQYRQAEESVISCEVREKFGKQVMMRAQLCDCVCDETNKYSESEKLRR